MTLHIRVIPRKLQFHAAMQNAQNVFESLQGHHLFSLLTWDFIGGQATPHRFLPYFRALPSSPGWL